MNSAIADIPELLRRFEIPGRVTMLEGNGDLPKIEVTSDAASAEVYLHGAHVTDFQKKGDAPLLFVSQCSRFDEGQPIRGGIPIVFPWFGPREGMPAHGFARLTTWELHETSTLPDHGVSLRFSLPKTALSATCPPFQAHYVVTVTDRLTLELIVTNASPDQPFIFENCLHTYFAVSDVSAIRITGLKETRYLDQVEGFAARGDTADAIEIASEVDRIYLDTRGPVEILDPNFRRKIRIEKTGSASTVVWNPWVQKSQQMPDFGNDEYRQMVCVESGNVASNRITLPPGKTSVLRVTLSSSPL